MKITKTDLRLGNIFKEGVVCKINGRTGAKIHLCGQMEYKNGELRNRTEVAVEHLTPIPLTPEILVEWCGFEKSTSDLWIKNGIEIWYRDSGFYHTEMSVGLNIEGLHELQNLVYALTKKELEIKD